MSANANSEFTDLVHELGHGVAAYDAKRYRGLLAAIRDWYMENEGIASYEDAIEAIMDRYAGTDEDFTRADAEEEFFSEAMAGLFSTDAGAKQFLNWLNDESKADTNEKKSIIKKMADLLQDLFDHIKALIRGGTLSKTAADFARMEADNAQMLRQEFLAALDTMKANAEKGEQNKSGTKNSVKELTGSKSKRYNKSVYDEFATNAMQWRFHPDTQLGDTKVLYRPKSNRSVVLIATEDGCRVLKGRVTSKEIRSISEAYYERLNERAQSVDRGNDEIGTVRNNRQERYNPSGELNGERRGSEGIDNVYPDGAEHGSNAEQDTVRINQEGHRIVESRERMVDSGGIRTDGLTDTDAEIDRKVKHSLGIAAATDTEKSLAARVTELESVNRDLERQVKDYRLQMKAGGWSDFDRLIRGKTLEEARIYAEKKGAAGLSTVEDHAGEELFARYARKDYRSYRELGRRGDIKREQESGRYHQAQQDGRRSAGEDSGTAADRDIDERVKHSLGITATEADRSLAARVTELESVNRDLERQVKDYRMQMKAGGVQHVTDIRKVKQAAPPGPTVHLVPGFFDFVPGILTFVCISVSIK
ncbi:MAG: hypothetical protein IKN72_07140 [Clostridia bacterium]|nr:hypothetical protein [Clostridia bacterium]